MSNIKELVANFDYRQRERLFQNLSWEERREVLQSFSNKPKKVTTDKIAIRIFEKMESIQNFHAPISRKVNRRSAIEWINRKLQIAKNEIAYFFGFLTANKTEQLVNNYLKIAKVVFSDTAMPISAAQLRKILTADCVIASENRVNLISILEKHGYPPILCNCKFEDLKIFSNLALEKITFQNCHFEWSHFSDAFLKEVTFDHCTLFNTSFLNAKIETCNFYNCNFQEVAFTGAKIESSNFSLCAINGSSFEDASIIFTAFLNTSLPATHFLQAFINHSYFISCNLKDAVFFGTLPSFILDKKSKQTAIVTRPTNAILVDPEIRGVAATKAYMKLEQIAGTIPLQVMMRAQKKALNKVNREIEKALTEIDCSLADKVPIPQQLIDYIIKKSKQNSESSKILKKVKKIASEVDSFFLSGGEDVPPALYGQKCEESTDWGKDYYRSILELGIIHQAFAKGIPLMAVCRGFQMANIYFGAQLLQDIKGQNGIQRFDLICSHHKGIYHSAFKSSLLSAVYHHQAVLENKGPTQHLEKSVIYRHTIKASELQYAGASPMILLQFHPEFYKATTAHNIKRELIDQLLQNLMSKNNELFWKILADSAKAYRIKKIVLSSLRKKASNETNKQKV